MYGYMWLLTKAQTELMAVDVPVNFYKRDKSKTKGEKKKFSAPSAVDLALAKARWEEKYAGRGGQKISLASLGLKIDLGGAKEAQIKD